jgi:hypothetical protein
MCVLQRKRCVVHNPIQIAPEADPQRAATAMVLCILCGS